MANACAHHKLPDHEDGVLTFARIEHFRGFASSWMKNQGKGYCDFDQWCRSAGTMNKGRARLTSRMHDVSLNHSRNRVNADVLRPYENADYSRVPVVRLHDSRIPWLGTARLFPKAHGIQVMVHTREHPPAHIHVEFLGSEEVVRLAWPSLSPLPGERGLSSREEKNLKAYLDVHRRDIDNKVQRAFHQATLVGAVV